MTKQTLIKHLEHMDAVLEKVSWNKDIWQNHCVYWMALAIKDILLEQYRDSKTEETYNTDIKKALNIFEQFREDEK